MEQLRSYSEINERIRNGSVVVMSAEEVKRLAANDGVDAVAREVDVVTTGTFGPMCSSGAFLNLGHSDPPIRMEEVTLGGVPAYAGLAAVDVYLGATEVCPSDPGRGGAHVIEELIRGRKVKLRARGKGTDCYPRKEIDTEVSLDGINEAYLFNPRNAYQNYTAATNSSSRMLYTYMGILLPQYGNVHYSTSGELSPLLNDPGLGTIGLGTRIFLGGAEGYVAWNGTQFHGTRPVNSHGIPTLPGATLALIGDLKRMDPEFIRAAYFDRYGVSMFVGVGIPIPILDRSVAASVSVRNRDITTTLLDYGIDGKPVLGTYSYEELRSGTVELNGTDVPTAPMSSLYKARLISDLLRKRIERGEQFLSEPVAPLPRGTSVRAMPMGGGPE